MTSFRLGRTCATCLCALWLAGCVQTLFRDQTSTISGPSVSIGFTFERALADGPSFSAYLVSYKSSGLKTYALVAVPRSKPPVAGYPVLIANHGFHPDPPKYGFTPAGVDSRPGDYYRVIPAKFAEYGFMVVMPDYRGHNVSEGKEFTKLPDSTSFYREDVLALIPLLASLEHADARNVFMWGHSMGGVVTVKTLFEAPTLRGASIWSTARIDDAQLAALKSVNVPLQIQHAAGDKTTSIEWSERAAKAASSAEKLEGYFVYTVDDHFFKPPQLDLAVGRDVAFFRKRLVSY